jgi:hypothetical protein
MNDGRKKKVFYRTCLLPKVQYQKQSTMIKLVAALRETTDLWQKIFSWNAPEQQVHWKDVALYNTDTSG